MNPPQHQMTPFANPKMHRGSASKSYFYNWYTVCYIHKRGEADLQELPSYFMDCTPHRIIKCTFKQHNRPCGWVVMLAWNWNSALWSKKQGPFGFFPVFQYVSSEILSFYKHVLTNIQQSSQHCQADLQFDKIFAEGHNLCWAVIWWYTSLLQ